jgi:hypothetical protein
MNETQSQIEFKDLQVEYVHQVAALHIQCINTGFISSMGIDFVTYLYEAIVQSNSSFGFVAARNGKVLGFAAFTTNINTLYKSIVWRKGLKFALLLAGHMCSLKRVKGRPYVFPKAGKKDVRDPVLSDQDKKYEPAFSRTAFNRYRRRRTAKGAGPPIN